MAKLSLTDIAAGYGLITTLNANNDAIETALENTLSRDGTSPNTMSAALDMNSQYINNLATPANDYDAATKKYIDDLSLSVTSSAGTFSADLAYDFSNQIDFYGAGGIRIMDTAQTDYVTIAHDGTDLDITPTQTRYIEIPSDADFYGLIVNTSTLGGGIRSYATGSGGGILAGQDSTHYIRLSHDGTDANIDFGTTTDCNVSAGATMVFANGNIFYQEAAAADTDRAGYGQIWIKSDTPNNLMFTDDAGNDVQITNNGALNTAADTTILMYKTADEAITSDNTLTLDTDLQDATLTADTWYKITGMLWFYQVNSTADINVNWYISQTQQDGRVSMIQSDSSTASNTLSYSTPINSAEAMAQQALTNSIVHVSGFVRTNATTAGTFGLQWAQNTSDSNATTLQAGSWIKLEPLA